MTLAGATKGKHRDDNRINSRLINFGRLVTVYFPRIMRLIYVQQHVNWSLALRNSTKTTGGF